MSREQVYYSLIWGKEFLAFGNYILVCDNVDDIDDIDELRNLQVIDDANLQIFQIYRFYYL